MRNPQEVLFGPVPDEQRDYWQKSKLAQRDASIIDSHFDRRSHGQRIQNSINAYALPRSAKVVLKETVIGGLPVWDGAETTWNRNYQQAQNKLLVPNTLEGLKDPWQGRRPGMVEEIDAGQILQQKMLAQAANPGGVTHGPMPGHSMVNGINQAPQQRTCMLVEGHTFFRPLQIQGFGTTQPLAKTGGQISGVQGREFVVEGTVTAYVVDGLQTIDLSKMEQARLKPLIRVSSPLLGSFLVPQEAIQESGSPYGQRQLLIDTNQQHRLDQRQQWLHQQQQQQLIAQQQQQRAVLSQTPSRPMNPQESLQAQSKALLARRGLLKG